MRVFQFRAGMQTHPYEDETARVPNLGWTCLPMPAHGCDR